MSMRNLRLGSARISRAGDGVLAIANFSEISARGGKSVAAGRRNQHARRVCYPAGTGGFPL
jgi:hypothetical protein